MPLSDHERRLLAEMEQALVAEDPKLVSTFEATPKIVRGSKGAALGAGLILLGFIALFAGLFTQLPLLGVIGFIVALAGTLSIIPKVSASKSSGAMGSPRSGRAGRSGRSMGRKIEDRWNRRSYE